MVSFTPSRTSLKLFIPIFILLTFISHPPYIVIKIIKKFIYALKLVYLLLSAAIVPVVSLALCIVITDNPFTMPDICKRIFIAMQLILCFRHFPYLHFCNIPILKLHLFFYYKFSL